MIDYNFHIQMIHLCECVSRSSTSSHIIDIVKENPQLIFLRNPQKSLGNVSHENIKMHCHKKNQLCVYRTN